MLGEDRRYMSAVCTHCVLTIAKLHEQQLYYMHYHEKTEHRLDIEEGQGYSTPPVSVFCYCVLYSHFSFYFHKQVNRWASSCCMIDVCPAH